MSTKTNYKAYDGSYYSVVLRDWPKAQAREYLIKTYGYNVSFPIKYVDCARESEQWKFLEIKKSESAEEAVPIVRIGDGKPRCPYCRERKCLIGSFSKDIPNIDYPEPDEADDAVKYLGYKRFIGQCLNPGNQGKYFIVEYRESYRASMDMLVKKQCPLCRAHDSITVVEITRPSPAERLRYYNDCADTVKGGHQAPIATNKAQDASSEGSAKSFIEIWDRLSEKDKKRIDNIKGIKYRCSSCDATATLFFDVEKEDKYYPKIKEVYLKK